MATPASLVAFTWLAVTRVPGGLALGTLLVVGAVARSAVSLGAGAITDRSSPTRVMLLCDIARVGIMLGIVAADELAAAPMLWFFGLQAAYGVVDTFFFSGLAVAVARLVPRGQLEAANGLHRATQSLAGIAGSALGGLAVAAFGPIPVLAGCGVLFGVAATALIPVGLAGLRDRAAGARGRQRPIELWRDAHDSLMTSLRDPLIRGVIGLIALIDFAFYGPYYVSLPLIAARRYGEAAGAAALGTMRAAWSVGALAGTLGAGASGEMRRPQLVLGACGAATGIGLAALAAGAQMPLYIAVMAGLGGAMGTFNVVYIAALQRRTRAEMLGRVRGVATLAEYSLAPTSYMLAGAAGAGGAGTLLAILGAGLTVGSLGIATNMGPGATSLPEQRQGTGAEGARAGRE